MDTTLGLQWISIAIIFLMGSIWSEDNVRFGYIVTAFMGGFFWWIGWLQFAYLGTVIPIIFMIAIISYLRSHLKYKFGVFGSQGGIIWKMLLFVVTMQFAIIIVNGMAVFQKQFTSNPSNEFTQYSLVTAQSVFAPFTTGIGGVDLVLAALTLGWMLLSLVWSMVFAFFNLFPTMVNVFGIPPLVAAAIAGGIYVLTGLELFMIIFKPFRATEV